MSEAVTCQEAEEIREQQHLLVEGLLEYSIRKHANVHAHLVRRHLQGDAASRYL